MSKFAKIALIMTVALSASQFAEANLITNGGFELSNSATATPTGWVNIGHSDGIITYAAFGTPAYEGLNFYDLGGYGNAAGPIGDGIGQSFATIVGQTYKVTFGLSAENASGVETLTVAAGSASIDYVLSIDGKGTFKRAFTTETFDFTATSALTTLSFVHTAGPGGANDPMIDGVSVERSIAAIPEPETYALMLGGLGMLAFARKRAAK
ncbi:MAG: DUF642 domain-containing protein [Rhizobacter sp.]|nr:DUF642 domain-containing protein [Burkholderiales bacterium]